MIELFGVKRKKKEEVEEKAVKGLTIFDYLRDIISNKKGNIYEKLDPNLKEFSPFQILRFLSLHEGYIPFIGMVNSFQSELTKKQMYKMLILLIPRTDKYINFPKKTKSDIDESDIDLVKRYFECSEFDAKEYIKLRFICGFELEQIKNAFGGKK
jgi:hypothetical protein